MSEGEDDHDDQDEQLDKQPVCAVYVGAAERSSAGAVMSFLGASVHGSFCEICRVQHALN
jgi:hypothetical protein